MEIIQTIAVVVVIAVAVYVLYTLIKLSDRVKEAPDEAPYKVEPADPTPDLAVPATDKPIKWTFANAPKPKRKYTKRSKYWNSTNVKTKMSKARKARKTSKSK